MSHISTRQPSGVILEVKWMGCKTGVDRVQGAQSRKRSGST